MPSLLSENAVHGFRETGFQPFFQIGGYQVIIGDSRTHRTGVTTGNVNVDLVDESSSFQQTQCFGGGWSFENSSRSILWKVDGSVLDLLDISVHSDVEKNTLRLRFPTTIIPTVNFFEQPHTATFLFVLTSDKTLYRFTLPHPAKSTTSSEGKVSSIFSGELAAEEKFQVCRTTTPRSFTIIDGTNFIFNCTNNVVLCGTGTQGSNYQEFGLQDASVMKKFWGLLPNLVRGSGVEDGVLSLATHQRCILTLSADGKVRLWSYDKRTCVQAWSLPNWSEQQKSTTKALLRVFPSSKDFSARVLIYTGTEIYVLDLVEGSSMGGNQEFVLSSDRIISAKHRANLFDAVATDDYLWSLWEPTRGSQIEFSFCPFASEDMSDLVRTDLWKAVLTDREAPGINTLEFKTAEAAYLSAIFHPGRFSVHIIKKALQRFRIETQGYATPSTSFEKLNNLTKLKAEVLETIRGTYQDLREEDEDEEDRRQSSWARFWRCCLESWKYDSTPIGLFASPSSGLVCLIAKGGFSVVRACDFAEDWDYAMKAQLQSDPQHFAQSPSLDTDFGLLLACARFCAVRVSGKWLASFYRRSNILYDCERSLESIERGDEGEDNFIQESSDDDQDNFIQESSDFLSNLLQILRAVPSFLNQVDALLDKFQQKSSEEIFPYQSSSFMGNHPHSAPQRHRNSEEDRRSLQHMMPSASTPDFHNLSANNRVGTFGSSVAGLSISYTVQQIAYSRFGLLRDISVLLTYLSTLSQKSGLSSSTLKTIATITLPRAVLLMRQYFVLSWLGGQFVIPSEAPQSFERLRITSQPEPFLSSNAYLNRPLLALFCDWVSESCNSSQQVYSSVTSAAANLVHLLWWREPNERLGLNDPKALPEGQLLKCEQHHHLEAYIRLLDRPAPFLLYLQGICYVKQQRYRDARECFLQASAGVAIADRRSFFVELLSKRSRYSSNSEGEDDARSSKDSPESSLASYFHEVLFWYLQERDELSGEGEDRQLRLNIATEMAVLALEHTRVSETQEKLLSKLFKLNLQRRNFEDAYDALMKRKKLSNDEIREFILTLCTQGGVRSLCQLPFTGDNIQVDTVGEILHNIAKESNDEEQRCKFYEILYSFHIARRNLHEAGQVMYELARRLEDHFTSYDPVSLRRRADVYLSAITALRLVHPDYAWVVETKSTEPHWQRSSSSKRKREEVDWLDMDHQSSVVTLNEIVQRYHILTSHLELLENTSKPPFAGALDSPENTVRALLHAGLFETALSRAVLFKIDLRPFFDAVTTRYLQLIDSQPGIGFSEEKTRCRQLLKLALKEHDPRFEYHTYVAEFLLSTQHPIGLPKSIVLNWRKRSPESLLRVYLRYDLLKATSLAIWMLNERKKARRHEEVWLPVLALDQLVFELENLENGKLSTAKSKIDHLNRLLAELNEEN